MPLDLHDLSLSLVPRRSPSREEALGQRVRMVLETQPGALPYKPAFGCDLDGLVGGTASQTRLSEARVRIAGALQRWLPDVDIAACTVELVEASGAVEADPSVPTAERALASAGLTAVLQIRVLISTPDGPVAVEADLTP